MPYLLTFADPVVAVRWRGSVESDEPNKLLADVRKYREKSGHKLNLVMVISGDLPIPSAEVRKVASSNMTRLLESECHEVDLVIEGHGVVRDMVRTIIRGLLVMLPGRQQVHVHDSVRRAVTRIYQSTPSKVGPTMDIIQPEERAL